MKIIPSATAILSVSSVSAFTTTPSIAKYAHHIHQNQPFTNKLSSIPLEDDYTPIAVTSSTHSLQDYHQDIATKPLISSASSSSSPSLSTSSAIEFPPPLTKLQRAQRAAAFSAGIAPIIISYLAKYTELNIRKSLTTTTVGQELSLSLEKEEDVWNELHSKGAEQLTSTILSLKGFYVKAAQIIGSRRDLFPKQYIDKLSVFTDSVDPLPVDVVKAVVQKELCNGSSEGFDDIFVEFDDEPLGAASIAQVHRAVLSEKYGSEVVAVKVQRPSIESKLLGDVANLKSIAKILRDLVPDLPLDYYTVFCELEVQLKEEFDFVGEAAAMERLYHVESPVVMPRPVGTLVSKRVLVMDYLAGVPLSRASEVMEKKGIKPGSAESQFFARKLLKSLTAVFGQTILQDGYFHGDPHPGNIFILEDGQIGLIDFGQVKSIDDGFRESIARVILALDERESDDNPADLQKIDHLARDLGIELKDNVPANGYAAVAMWLFDGSAETYPDGYTMGELSAQSPVKAMKSFPQDLVLVARNTVLVKGMANRFGIDWSLSKQWAPTARNVLGAGKNGDHEHEKEGKGGQRSKIQRIKTWGKNTGSMVLSKLPSPIRSKVVSVALRIQRSRGRL